MFRLLVVTLVVSSVGWYSSAEAQGLRGGRGGGPGRGPDARQAADMEVFHYLLENHTKIQRTVKELANGVETLTESDDPQVAAKIKEHVHWMEVRIEKTNPIRRRDPLFDELFRHTDKIKLKVEKTDKGVKVVETSDDPYVVKLIQAHAMVVSKFVKDGFQEAMKNHSVPGKDVSVKTEKSFPVIQEYGGVYHLPDAVQQPRPGTKILVDITAASEPDKLNPAIEKVARYVNIYAGAGKEKVDVEIALVFHGGATLAVLNEEAYKNEFKTENNPNLKLLRDLHHAGVEMVVCGQTLSSKGKSPGDVVVFVDTAVSAFTASVNFQADGFAYVPLAK
ncbi:DsrE family protein [Blastopirellula marina]|uniref:Uncharacterized protein n=1 Tax=Blastopirellula marina TaxID=124 RepID=A0A2S8G9X4_9BACT|nr:DsrE family protein [Blastopirellula marina]PQO41110.1 hypothetical protein C5Y98_03900 [Blastopirellula marina]PTL45986.1 hypothetical protein C5Y97_03900 [Blastopirellula marina]